MNNIQKSFKNKAKMGLRMASGGFISTIPDATFGGRQAGMGNVGMFDGGRGTATGLGGSVQRMSMGGSGGELTPTLPTPTPGLAQPAQSGTMNKLDGQIAMGNAVGNSNLTMGEKAALGMGTTAADASALRNQTSALTSLRDGMAQNMADGGVVETPDQLMARMAAKYGGGAAAATRPAEPAPAPQQVAAAPAPAPQGGLLQRAVRGMSNRAAQIEAATNFAEGGIVRGQGGVDKVPMNISGVDVNLTGGKTPEAVLPSKTVQSLGGPEAVEELIERTNGKPPVKSGLRAGGRYGNGVVQDGVRTGVRKGGRTNWVNPETRVVPYEQPVIESTATRVPNNPPEFIRQDAQPRALNQNSPLYESLRVQPKPAPAPSTSVVPASPVNSNMNERVGNTGAAPQAEPYKPNWTTGSKGGSVVPYTTGDAASAAARSANEINQASVIKEAMRKNNLHPVMAAAEKAGEYLGPKVASTLRGAQNFVRAAAPAADLAVPLMAAYDANYGNDAIRVNAVNDPNSTIGEGLLGVAKQTALRAGDWGTKGLDALASPFTAALNVGSRTLGSGQRFNYNTANDFYREGMRNGVDDISAPASPEYAKATRQLTPEQQAHQRILNDPTGGVGKIPGLKTPEQKQVAMAANVPVQATAIQAARDEPNAELLNRVTGSGTIPAGLRASIDQGGGQRLNFSSPNDVAASTIDNKRYQENGEGVASMRQRDGSYKNTVLGAGTKKWEDGPEYAAALKRNEQDKVSLRGMQRDRLMRDLGGDIKDPRVTQAAMLGLDQMNKGEALDNERSRYGNEQMYKIADLGLRRQQAQIAQGNVEADNRRADKAQREGSAKDVDKALSDMIENMVPTAGLKEDALLAAQAKQSEMRRALLESYGGQLPPDVATLQTDLPGRLKQAALTAALNNAVRNRGPVDKLRNVLSGNRQPKVSTDPNLPVSDRSWLSLDYNGIPLFSNDVFNGDADLEAAYAERLAAQKQKTLKNNASR